MESGEFTCLARSVPLGNGEVPADDVEDQNESQNLHPTRRSMKAVALGPRMPAPPIAILPIRVLRRYADVVLGDELAVVQLDTTWNIPDLALVFVTVACEGSS
jgi:hypothetical protein